LFIPSNKEILVEINNDQYKDCERIAEGRYIHKRRLKIKNQKIDKTRSDWKIEIGGMLNEYAVSQFAGTKVDRRSLLGGDGGIDGHWPIRCGDKELGAYTYDAKFSNYRTGRFIFFDHRKMIADLGVLGVPGRDYPKSIILIGWIDAEYYHHHYHVKQFQTPVHCLHQSEMRPLIGIGRQLYDDFICPGIGEVSLREFPPLDNHR